MTVFIALLRAVNVGGRTLPMEDVRRSLEGLGLQDVRTHLQSGNVVFGAEGGAPQEHAAAIEIRIERDLGPRVAVLVLTGGEMAEVVAASPFLTASGTAPHGEAGGQEGPKADDEPLHATFVFTAAGEDDFGTASAAAYSAVYESAFEKLALPAAEGERAVFVGSPPLATPVVYLHLPHGYGRTKLDNAFFERKLGAAATTRSWRTVRSLAELSGASRD
jgi:uncharacterized protein (DUF1697 family)